MALFTRSSSDQYVVNFAALLETKLLYVFPFRFISYSGYCPKALQSPGCDQQSKKEHASSHLEKIYMDFLLVPSEKSVN